MNGYARPGGRKGIRNVVVVAYLVECAHHVAREIALAYRQRGVHLIGFPGCFPNAYADRIMRQVTTHPNVGAVLLVSLGCESFDRGGLAEMVAASGRPVHTVVIQASGGTTASIAEGRNWVEKALQSLAGTPRVPIDLSELVVGVICGGSDATSGLTANPAVGRASDLLIEQGATVIFEETGELIGCEKFMAARAASTDLGREIIASVEKAARYYTAYGHSSFAPGNAEGGLTTIEEKSLGAYSKSGRSTICGLIQPGEVPPRGGLHLMDVVPDGEPRFGFPNISDNAEIVEMIASGAHVTLFTTGRGSVVGSAISPVIKVCANPETWRRMGEDMDINAGRILDCAADLDEVGREIFDCVVRTSAGQPTRSEALGHQEFILTYK
ncbi:MAG: UxaA family hydrolase [Thermoguttaceae bacterium]|jgi:altronate dehydratase